MLLPLVCSRLTRSVGVKQGILKTILKLPVQGVNSQFTRGERIRPINPVNLILVIHQPPSNCVQLPLFGVAAGF